MSRFRGTRYALLSGSGVGAGGDGGGGGAPLDDVSGITAAWSASRDLLTSFIGGSRYTDAGSGAISSLNDQSGNNRHLTDGASAARRPTLSTAGPNSRSCLDFDGSSDRLSGTGMSAFIGASAGWMIASFMADAISANDTGSPYQNHAIIGDAGGFVGLYLRNPAGSPETVMAYNWDGSADAAQSNTISLNTVYVVEWWHEGGSVFVCVNNGTPVSVASGNTTDLTGVIGIGLGYTGSTNYFNGKIFELATASAKPTDRATIAADFMTHVGAV